MRIKIDGELYHVSKVYNHGYLPMIETEEGEDFYLSESSEKAGEAARQYWEELAQNDPKEFACLVGEETLVKWGMRHYAGPGSTQVRSLEEWLDLWLDTPEEEFASYDSIERSVERVGVLARELDFIPCVAYRYN
jgi:hypothetical protein